MSAWIVLGSYSFSKGAPRPFIIDYPGKNTWPPPSQSLGRRRKYFTVEEANKALPLVKMIVADIVRQYRVVEDLQQRLSRVSKERRKPSKDMYAEELEQSQSELDTQEQKLMSYIEELKRLGVEFKGPELCDFYSILDGREVFLCWRLGEPEVSHWHPLDAGFSGRHPLTVERGRSTTTTCSEKRSRGRGGAY